MAHVHTASFRHPAGSTSSRHRVGATPRRVGLFRLSLSAASDKCVQPLYLRESDAKVPGPRKRAGTGER